MKSLLAVIDMQNDFVSGALKNVAAEKIIPRIAAEIENARAGGAEVVFTRDTHKSDYLSTQEGRLLPVEHCIVGTSGHEIVDALKKYSRGARVFDKPAFGSVELGEYVRDGRFDKVTLVGVCTDICVISNAFLIKAFSPETAVCVKKDLCAGVTADSHSVALSAMAAAQIVVE